MHGKWAHRSGTRLDSHPALGPPGVRSNPGGLIVDGFGDTVHRYLPPVGQFVFALKILTPPPSQTKENTA